MLHYSQYQLLTESNIVSIFLKFLIDNQLHLFVVLVLIFIAIVKVILITAKWLNEHSVIHKSIEDRFVLNEYKLQQTEKRADKIGDDVETIKTDVGQIKIKLKEKYAAQESNSREIKQAKAC